MLSISRIRHATSALLALVVLACSEAPPTGPVAPDPTPPTPPAAGRLGVFASLTEGTTSLVISVSGAGIVKADGITPDTLVFNIGLTGVTASGSILVPAGTARLVVARAYAGLVETHRGSVTTDIVEGTNATLNISMVPLAGTAPIVVTFGTTLVIVRPLLATVAIGDTLRMTAEVRDRDGNIVAGARARWASLNPSRASIDTLGLVTMRDTGEVQVVATYGTVGGSAKLTGRSATSERPYQLTWNGSVSRSWTEINNWTPHGLGAARVPTSSDSVVIPAGITNQPRLETCADGHAQHVLIETGASLGSTCGYVINVYGTIVANGTATRIGARPGARLRGVIDYLVVRGDSVRLLDSLRAGTLEVNSTGAQLRLNGKRLNVTGNLNIYDGTIRIVDGDTLTVGGDVYWAGADQTDLLTGGVVYFRGNSFYGYRYYANGTNRLVFDRSAGRQSISGFDFLSDISRAAVRKLDVRNRDGLSICGHVRVTDTLAVTSTGTPLPMDNSTCGSFYMRADGPIVSSANTQLGGYLWDIRHVSGTSLVGGTWNPTHTDLNVANAVVKPGLSYVHLRFYASGQLSGPTSATGYLWVDGATTVMSLNGNQMNADRLDVRNGALLVMTNALDTLKVASIAEFHHNNSVAQGPLMSAGSLRVGGRFYGHGFSATGTHKVVLTGAVSDRYIHGMNYESRPEQGFMHLEVQGTYGVCERVRVKATTLVKAAAALDQSVCAGSGYLRYDGDLTSEAGSNISPYLVQVYSASGTQNVAGAWSPTYTDYHTTDAFVKSGLAYQNLRIFTSTRLQGNTTATGELWVDGTAAKLKINSHRLTVDNLDVRNGALLEMDHVEDTLDVAGLAEFHHNNSDVQGPLLSAGVIRVGGRFYGHGFSGTGTHKVILTGAGTTPGDTYIHGMNYESRPAQGFNRLEVQGVYAVCERTRVKDTLWVKAGGALDQHVCTSSGYLRTDAVFKTDPGTNISPYNVAINNATGTQEVGGSYAPTYTSVHVPLAAGTLKATLDYQHVYFYASVTLGDSLQVDGELNISNTGTIFNLNGRKVRVAGRLDMNSNATIQMTNAADSLILNGSDTYWDSGDHTGKLTDGTVFVNVGYFCASAYNGSLNHKTVFSRTAGDRTRMACISSSEASAAPFNNVEIRNDGVRLECYMRVTGNLLVKAGSTVEQNCGSGTLWVSGTLNTEAGSAVTNGPSYPGSHRLSVVLYNASGTSSVLGSWDPDGTYFLALGAQIKPSLSYRYTRVDRSTTLLGNTVVNGAMDVINDGTVLQLGGYTLDVKYGFNLDNTAIVQMTNALDTLKVGQLDPSADMFWDGGTKPAGSQTNGAIVFYGDRFYGFNYKPTTGTPHRFIFKSDAPGAAISLEGNTTFANLEFAGLRSVDINSQLTVGDTLKITAPTLLTGVSSDYVHVMNGGRLITVAGSNITVPHVYLDDPTGTKFVAGGFNPTNTTYFRAATGLADAIKAGLGYNNISIEGDYQLASNLTLVGTMTVHETAGRLTLNGQDLTVGGNFDVFTNGRLVMNSPSDSLDVGGFFRINSSTGTSIMSDGKLVVRGDHYTMNQDGSGATGNHKLILAGTGAGFQDINTGNIGSRNIRNMELRGTRSARFTNQARITGTLDIVSATTLTANTTHQLEFQGPVSSVAGSAMVFTGVTIFDDGAGTGGLAGTFANTGTTYLTAGASTLKTGAGMSYSTLNLQGNVTVSGGALVSTGALTLNAGGVLSLPASSVVGGSVTNNGTMTWGGGSSITGSMTNTSGVTFSGAFTSPGTFTNNSPGTATASGLGSTDCVDFLQATGTAYSLQTGSSLNNTVASSTGCGFRKKAAATVGGSGGASTVTGPAIGTAP